MQISSGITIKISKKKYDMPKWVRLQMPTSCAPLVAGAATLSKSALTIIIRAPYEIMCVFAH